MNMEGPAQELPAIEAGSQNNIAPSLSDLTVPQEVMVQEPKQEQVRELHTRLETIFHLRSVEALLGWDQQVYMIHTGVNRSLRIVDGR